jgi:hypothetical protein
VSSWLQHLQPLPMAQGISTLGADSFGPWRTWQHASPKSIATHRGRQAQQGHMT